ncbi:MAG TPA: hypothetical protein VGP94_13975 [Tepidisphaeraceae bacterium]|jgi:hypothetical protein|nr:hypothetical protein [Tepidisphaeraceae bacterium]
MRSDRERRREDIRDEMLIDMARGIQLLLGCSVGYRDDKALTAPLSVISRLDSHISILERAKKND